MKLTLIEGDAIILVCAGCNKDGVGGTEIYSSASSGESRLPDLWYQEVATTAVSWCATCAAKLVEQDPTRSVNQFYSDTTGAEIKPENLPDL